jgi:ferredoxin
MKVEVHADRCVAAGLCVMAEDGVFDQDPATGTVVLVEENPEPALRDGVREAARICPALAISVREDAESGR